MQQLGFYGGIGAHSQREPSLWPGQPSRALDELAPHGAELLELPQWCALVSSVSFLLITTHLHFPVEVMRQHGREEIDLIAGLFSGRHVVHLSLRLELSENALLGTASMMEAQRLVGRKLLVSDDHLEVIAVLVGDEQIQLYRTLVLLAILAADKHKAVSSIPTRRFPVRFKEAPLCVQVTPALSVLDQCLEGAKALKRHADGELNPLCV